MRTSRAARVLGRWSLLKPYSWLRVSTARREGILCLPDHMEFDSGKGLGDGRKIPAVGLGLYYTPPGAATYDIVAEALKLGYR